MYYILKDTENNVYIELDNPALPDMSAYWSIEEEAQATLFKSEDAKAFIKRHQDMNDIQLVMIEAPEPQTKKEYYVKDVEENSFIYLTQPKNPKNSVFYTMQLMEQATPLSKEDAEKFIEVHTHRSLALVKETDNYILDVALPETRKLCAIRTTDFGNYLSVERYPGMTYLFTPNPSKIKLFFSMEEAKYTVAELGTENLEIVEVQLVMPKFNG